eukprot:9130552-Pyramimonas_sp.AAC.1
MDSPVRVLGDKQLRRSTPTAQYLIKYAPLQVWLVELVKKHTSCKRVSQTPLSRMARTAHTTHFYWL